MSKLFLAPMEGLADCVLRDVLTRVGGYDGVVTEFVRVSGSVLPNRTFQRIAPELNNASRTRAGTPVVVQLLGSDPELMGENAARLAALAPAGIDLNFGCPAPTVNRHGGGAMLLEEPERLCRIVSAVRRSVPTSIPVTAKMRLGVSDTGKALECALALEAGGAASLVVHARTKDQGYKPPAHWEWIARIRETVAIPVVANGEVWSFDDYERCRAVSGCADVMIGRGAVADPFLVRRIKAKMAGEVRGMDETDRRHDWVELRPLLEEYWRLVLSRVEPRYVSGRIKLWLGALRKTFPEAESLYGEVRTARKVDDVVRVLGSHGVVVSSERERS